MKTSWIDRAWAVGRLLLALGSVVLALGIGYELGKLLPDALPSSVHATQLAQYVGIAFVFATLNTFFERLPPLVRWIRSGGGNALYSFGTLVFMSTIAVSAAMAVQFQGEGDPPTVSRPIPPVANAYSVVFAQVPAPEVVEPAQNQARFMIPFFAEARGCKTDHEHFKRGYALHADTRSFLESIAAGLLSCADRAPVEIEVRGFASSAPFEDCDDSDELNRMIANYRGEAVATVLEDAIALARGSGAEGAIRIAPREWGSHLDMYRSIGFEDRIDGVYSTERALLTRRAEVVVVDAGGCRVTSNTVRRVQQADRGPIGAGRGATS